VRENLTVRQIQHYGLDVPPNQFHVPGTTRAELMPEGQKTMVRSGHAATPPPQTTPAVS
jgi:hypothetical protein